MEAGLQTADNTAIVLRGGAGAGMDYVAKSSISGLFALHILLGGPDAG